MAYFLKRISDKNKKYQQENMKKAKASFAF